MRLPRRCWRRTRTSPPCRSPARASSTCACRDVFWAAQLATILPTGTAYGRSTLGGGQKVNVEYVSANPTGPMHVGHCRGAVVRRCLANLLAATGHAVTREYYINDAGAQVDALARSAHLRYREALGEDDRRDPERALSRRLSEAGRRGPRRRSSATALLEAAEAEWLPVVRERTIAAMMDDDPRRSRSASAVHHDVFFSERSLQVGQRSTESRRRSRRLRGEGPGLSRARLPPPKGQLPEDWEDREQTLFRSTAFGDDVDRPLLKSDGSYTYFASDIAYHYDKYLRGFRPDDRRAGRRPWRLREAHEGCRHGGERRRGDARRQVLPAGEAVPRRRAGRMSKRSGDLVTLREVVEEVGAGLGALHDAFPQDRCAARLRFRQSHGAVEGQSGLLRAVRPCALLLRCVPPGDGRSSKPQLGAGRPGGGGFPRPDGCRRARSIRGLAEYPRVLEIAAACAEPHKIAFFLHDLASAFHTHWNKGKELPQLRFVNQGNPARRRRVWLWFTVFARSSHPA